MAKISYEQARTDHEYLWDVYGPAADMTGGYVDQEDLAKLLRDPTKKTATACYTSQIVYWFTVGPERPEYRTASDLWKYDTMVYEIAERYGFENKVEWQGPAAEMAAGTLTFEDDDAPQP